MRTLTRLSKASDATPSQAPETAPELSAANLLERLRLVMAQETTDAPREVMLHAYAH